MVDGNHPHLLIIDDPISDEPVWGNSVLRQMLRDWWADTHQLKPNEDSSFVRAAKWHLDDVAQKLLDGTIFLPPEDVRFSMDGWVQETNAFPSGEHDDMPVWGDR